MKHGGGGRATRALINDLLVRGFDEPAQGFGLAALDDGAAIPLGDGRWLIVTTDSHVIQPIIFPGGDIGRLSICGTVNDLAMMARVSARPPQIFADEQEAISRFLRVSGLDGLLAPKLAGDGVYADGSGGDGQGWRLAVDPPVHGVAGGDFAALLARVKAPVLLVTGELDPMAPPEALARFDAPLRVVAGMGHSLHVEDPAGFADLVVAELQDSGL